MDREAEALRGRTWVTRSAAETEALGAAVGRALTGGAVLALFGGLGMGKTAFVRGLAAGRDWRPRYPARRSRWCMNTAGSRRWCISTCTG